MQDVTYQIEDQQRMTRARNYFAWQAALVLPELGQRVIELGCGLGNFTGMLLDREVVLALDTEPECVARLNARYPGRPNLNTFTGDSVQRQHDLARFQPDSCVCLNVLEHIADDRATLESVRAVLAPGGVMVLLVPAFPALYGPIDENLGHARRYTRRSITELAAAGFEVKKLHYVNLLGFFGWWLNARVFRRHAQSAFQIALFDRAIVPVMSRLERIAPPPFGQSLFAVLRKR
jgi:SAM-dependent methyltransferase